jgi:preprotein translocase subunit SecG
MLGTISKHLIATTPQGKASLWLNVLLLFIMVFMMFMSSPGSSSTAAASSGDEANPPAESGTARFITILCMVLWAMFSVYSINCMVAGGCHRFAWLNVGIIAIILASTVSALIEFLTKKPQGPSSNKDKPAASSSSKDSKSPAKKASSVSKDSSGSDEDGSSARDGEDDNVKPYESA